MSAPAAPLRASNAAAIASALWDSADFAGAARHYERALAEDPTDIEALHGLGRLKLAQNEAAAALVLLERAESLATALPAAQSAELVRRIRHDLAWTFYRLDRYDLAAAHFARLPGQGARAAHFAAFGERAPYQTSAWDEVVVPFLGTFPLPIIALTVGASDHPFVIDTGSDHLVLDTGLFQELGLPHLGASQASLASGASAAVVHTILPQLMLGDITLRDIPAEAMDIRRFAPQITGLIGASFLRRFHVLCDWTGKRLYLRPRSAAPFEQFTEMTVVPFWLFDGHLMLAPARLNEHETIAYIASGMAGGAFALPAATAASAALEWDDGEIEGVAASGKTTLATVRARQLCLGDWCRHDLEGFAGFFPEALEWRYGFRVGALFSHEFLKGNRWGIDFQRMRLYFS